MGLKSSARAAPELADLIVENLRPVGDWAYGSARDLRSNMNSLLGALKLPIRISDEAWRQPTVGFTQGAKRLAKWTGAGQD